MLLPDLFQHCALIVNTHARRGESGLGEVQATLHELEIEPVFTSTGVRFGEEVEKARKEGAKVFLVGGGDGTQAQAAKLLKEDEILGVIPLGTGNALAHDLGIPNSITEAVKQLAEGEIRTIDIGSANGTAFVNVATIGLTTQIARQLQTINKGILGKAAYLPALWRAVRASKAFNIAVHAGEKSFDGTALQFVAAAGRTHAGPFRVTEQAENDDRLLSVYVLEGSRKSELFKFGIGLLLGKQTQLPEVWTVETPRVTVKTQKPKTVIVDGEQAAKTPVDIEILGRRLQVLVPKPTS